MKTEEWTTPDAIEGRMGRTLRNDDFHFKPKNMNLIYINGKRFETEKDTMLKSEICALIKYAHENSTVSYQDGDNIDSFPVPIKNMDHFQIIHNSVIGG